jgi:hypothetical protein
MIALGGWFVWAQATLPGTDPTVVARIALRRWFAGLTLSAPEPLPSRDGLLALLGGLGLLLLVAIAAQGPMRALRQLVDVPGHLRVVAASLSRFRRAARLVAALFGATVLGWTAWQSRFYGSVGRLEDLGVLRKTKGIGELAVEQGLLAALTPLRDLCGLADMFVLLLAASALVFKLSADRWGVNGPPPGAPRLPGWTTPAWAAAWVYTLYRLAGAFWMPDGYPLRGLVIIEAVVVPPLMLTCDALIFAWVLTELRHAISDAADEPVRFEAAEAVARLPSAMLACFVALPARYLATLAWLIVPYVSSGSPEPLRLGVAGLLLGWGLVWAQAAALPLLPIVSAAAWAGTRGGTLRLAARLVRAEGGRLVAVVAGATVAAGLLAALAYGVVLQLPAQPWVLAAADSYAHYATLPIGLLLLATLVELADRATRQPTPARPDAIEEVAFVVSAPEPVALGPGGEGG